MGKAISKLSANAISAKAHAMYADMLSAADYEALANCRTVNEAAGYLKAHRLRLGIFVFGECPFSPRAVGSHGQQIYAVAHCFSLHL